MPLEAIASERNIASDLCENGIIQTALLRPRPQRVLRLQNTAPWRLIHEKLYHPAYEPGTRNPFRPRLNTAQPSRRSSNQDGGPAARRIQPPRQR